MKKCEKVKLSLYYKNYAKIESKNSFSHFQHSYCYDEMKFKNTKEKK